MMTYHRFFGFQRAPFELVPDPDFLFLGESHESALANLVLGIESGKGFVAISGPVGAGKTTVLRALLRRMPRDQRVCFLSQPESEVSDLLRGIVHGFGITGKGLDRVEMRQAIRDLLESLARPGVLIVDEAHLLNEESLEQIRLLSNLEEDDHKLLQIILSGQPELKELLSRPRLRPLTQRIEMFYDIQPLDRRETAAYIDRRVRIAGNPDGLEFETKGLDAIADMSGGIPRLINVLADRCLITAYVAETRTITPSIVREAYEDLGEVTQSVMAGPAVRARVERPAPPPRPRTVAPPPEPEPPRREAAPALEVQRAEPEPIFSAPSPESIAAPSRLFERRAHRGGPERADRWFALAGIVAVGLVAVLSLGNRTAPGGPTPTVADPVARAATPAEPTPASVFTLEIAALRRLGDARELARELRTETGEVVRISPIEDASGTSYRVWFGEYRDGATARETMDRLAAGSSRWERARVITIDDGGGGASGQRP